MNYQPKLHALLRGNPWKLPYMLAVFDPPQNGLKPPVNNGIWYLPYQLVIAGFLNHQPHGEPNIYASKGTQREKSPWTASTPTNAAWRDDFDRADASHSSHFQPMAGSKLLTLVFQSYLLRFSRCLDGMLFGVQIPTKTRCPRKPRVILGMVIPPLIQNPYI